MVVAVNDTRTDLSGHRVAYHRMTGDQMMLLLTLLIKYDAAFSGRDGLDHLADGLRHSSLTGMCLALWVRLVLSGFGFETMSGFAGHRSIRLGRYVGGDNGAFLF